MGRKRIKIYWLLLLVLLYTASAVMAVGETQARYVNTATWDTVVSISEDQVNSNLLRNTMQSPVTILLGEMRQEIAVSIVLQSEVDTEGALAWSVSLKDYENYFSVRMSTGGKVYENQEVIQLEAGVPVTVNMRLIPSDDAFTVVRDAISAIVTVQWGDTLEGTFQVDLPEIVGETEPDNDIEIDISTQSEDLATGSDDPEIDIEIDIGGADQEDNAGDGGQSETEPDSKIEIDVDFGKPDQGDDPPEEEQEDPEKDTEIDINIGIGDGTKEPETNVDPEIDETEPVVTDFSVEVIEDENQLLLQLAIPENVATVKIGMSAAEPSVDLSVNISGGASTGGSSSSSSDMAIDQFPARVCYSLDEGKSYYMLYHGGYIRLEQKGGSIVSVMLDFSNVLQKESKWDVAVVAYEGDALVASGGGEYQVAATQTVELSSRFLTTGEKITIAIPKSWQAYDFECALDMLAVDEDTGELTYVPVDPESNSFELSMDSETGAVILRLGEKLPQAGSYRITMNWNSKGACIEQVQETFFINYMSHFDTVKTGGAAQ